MTFFMTLRREKMTTQELAKKIAVDNNLIKADKYDLSLREFDNKVELIGLVQDPNYDMKDFEGREMLFPKRWVTLGVFDFDMKVAA
jgi:hypothetical protein